MDYSKTVNLPKTDFPMKADLPKREPARLEQWEKEQVYQAALKRRAGKTPFILHDGPPYANGHLHLGHALNKILKDIIVRSKTMAGFYAPYVPGWDCHGLPIELQLMKELKVTDKHKVDRAQFREQAKAFAQRFVDIQRQEFKRMGVLGDWENPYLTMDERYKATIISTFEELQKKGYVYKGKKPVYWCATDETALAEAEVEYEDDPGPSIYVGFPLALGPDGKVWPDNAFYAVWTTTPWTLPANVAIAYNSEEKYVLFESDSTKKYILAAPRLEHFKNITGLSGKVIDEVEGNSFFGAWAHHPWLSKKVPLLAAGFVAMDTGTGLVHIAPGHGREDYVLGQQQNPALPVISPVTDRGLFTDEVPEWKGQHVFKANPLIIEFLREKGRLLHSEEITHSYPHCWRCHKPVIFRATEQWFLAIDKDDLRQRLLSALESVSFFPDFGRNRITGMVESRPDWCLSRQRLWGTEIPVGEYGSKGVRDPDIFDVWFESGVSWAAVLKARSELKYPADLYLEGSDQHRGWFQVSLIPSVALENQAPFKALLTHGFVMDGEGRPMSKSLGNVIAPEEIIKQYGADILRFWVASSDYGNDIRLSPEILKGLADNYRKLRNTFRYLLNNLSDFDPQKDAVPLKDLAEIDQWALHRLQEEIRDATKAYEEYQFHRVTGRLVTFCNSDLSSFYLDIIKDRLYCDPVASRSRRGAQTVLYRIADSLFRLLAPILAFTTDECWRFLGAPEAVALMDMAEVDSSCLNETLAADWKKLFVMREQILAELEKARAAGVVKAPREAKAIVQLPQAADAAFFIRYGDTLPALLGVGQAAISAGPAQTIVIQKAEGAKCERCWIFKTDLGVAPAHPTLCARCASAVQEWEKTCTA